MIVIRKIKSLFYILNREYSWLRDSKECRKKLSPKKIQKVPTGKKIILMPHSDDEWIGCSQILLEQPEQIIVVNMDMKGGDDEKIHLLRRREAESVAKKYNYKFLTVGDRLKDLIQIFVHENPICVFLPCYLDWHEEHIETIRIFSEAASQAGYMGIVGMYQLSLPIPEKLINCGMCMTKRQLKEKWKNLEKMYKTQEFLPTRRFMLNEFINGAISDSYSLEAYCLMNYDEWEHAANVGIMSAECRKEAFTHLKDIRYIKELLERCMKVV